MPGMVQQQRPVPPESRHLPRPPQSQPSRVEQGIRTRIARPKASQTYRRGGMNITVKADTARVDVQRAYQQMYFAAHDDTDSDDGLGAALKRRFRAASYRMGGQDWEFLFRAYDRNNDGTLSRKEFIHATRRDAQISPAVLTDKQLEVIFDRIDMDSNSAISCDEFLQWLGNIKHKYDPLRDGVIVPGTPGGEEGEGSDDTRQQPQNQVPFVAEYIALQRATLRSGQDITSPKIGMLSTGEVVAVLQVHGRRMKVQRLKYQANPKNGWVSDRTAALTPIMERLPREEWSSIKGHTTAVAERVAALNSMPEKKLARPGTWYTSIFADGGPTTSNDRPMKGARSPADGSMVPVPPVSTEAFVQEALRKSEARVDHLARAMERAIEEREAARLAALAEAETVTAAFEEARHLSSEIERNRLKKQEEDRLASEELMKCESTAEVKELLGLLESTHRVRWDTLLLGKHAEVERIRRYRAQQRKEQMLAYSAGVRRARGQKVDREMDAVDSAKRATSMMFSQLAGHSDAQSADDVGADAKVNNDTTASGTESSIDRILKKFSPRSGGSLHSVAAHSDGERSVTCKSSDDMKST